MVYRSFFSVFLNASRVTERQTDGQTEGQIEFSSLDRVCICSAVKILVAASKLQFNLLFYSKQQLFSAYFTVATRHNLYKMLSYRRETALQGAL